MPKVGAFFWDRVDRTEGCWVWMGARVSKGYGNLWHGGKSISAHRHAWELTVGPIPPGMHVLHHCDNPPCVRPDHLWLGTNRENQIDSRDKGRRAHLASRLPYQTCEHCGARFRVSNLTRPRRYCGRACIARLTPENLVAIRSELAVGVSQAALAREYQVSAMTIWTIAVGRR